MTRTGLSVGDAKPVGVILTPTVSASTAGPAAVRTDSKLVLTRAAGSGMPGALTVTFDGYSASYDPDGLPGPAPSPATTNPTD